jgi:hypothetical protein
MLIKYLDVNWTFSPIRGSVRGTIQHDLQCFLSLFRSVQGLGLFLTGGFIICVLFCHLGSNRKYYDMLLCWSKFYCLYFGDGFHFLLNVLV